MTPQQHAERVVADVKDHKMFNVDTDGTWVRYIASAIKNALDDELPNANDLDEVVHALGIEDSDTAPAEATDTITIRISVFASGCLPGVLESRIEQVERHTKVSGHLYTLETLNDAEHFLNQMRECLAAVTAARAAYVKGV